MISNPPPPTPSPPHDKILLLGHRVWVWLRPSRHGPFQLLQALGGAWLIPRNVDRRDWAETKLHSALEEVPRWAALAGEGVGRVAHLDYMEHERKGKHILTLTKGPC